MIEPAIVNGLQEAYLQPEANVSMTSPLEQSCTGWEHYSTDCLMPALEKLIQ